MNTIFRAYGSVVSDKWCVVGALKLPLEGKWSALADRKGDLTRVNLKLFIITRRSNLEDNWIATVLSEPRDDVYIL